MVHEFKCPFRHVASFLKMCVRWWGGRLIKKILNKINGGRGTAKNNRNPNPEGEMYYTYNFDFPVHFLVFTLIFLSVSKKGPTV